MATTIGRVRQLLDRTTRLEYKTERRLDNLKRQLVAVRQAKEQITVQLLELEKRGENK